MKNFSHPQPSLLLSILVGGLLLSSCGSAPTGGGDELASQNVQGEQVAAEAPEGGESATQEVPEQKPQLVKKAALTVLVDSLDPTLEEVSTIIDEQQGDLLSLEDNKSENRPTASITLRVPQDKLESTLEKLGQLGTVENRSVTAEDVSNQLVDYQARLNNLRKTEAQLLKIMDQAGAMNDVLRVAQELSNVRQSIEQIEAQLKSLRNQIAYSTITLKLEGTVASSSPQRAFNSQVEDTWRSSTRSFRSFLVGLLQLGIWLMVYSPVWIALAVMGYGVWRLRKSQNEAKNP